jgi:hypothetical protein
MQVCWTHRPESKLSHRHRRTDLGPFDRSFLFTKPLNCLPDSLRKKPCKQVARPNCASTPLYPPRYGAYLPNSGRLCAINVASNFFHKILFPAYKVSKGEIFFCRRQSCSATNALWRDASYRFKYHPPRKNLHQRQEKISPSLFNCRI